MGFRQERVAHERPQSDHGLVAGGPARSCHHEGTSIGASRYRSTAYEDKRIYVWFEAVIGYLSATKEWAKRSGQPDAWKRFWENPDAETYYFQGKDNIPFHTLIWPAMLMGYGGLNLPTDVAANEYLNFKGQEFSKSRNWAVWLPDYLERYEVDPLRYYLASTMPETSDSDFTWEGFVAANNNELVATFGNFVHRVLTLTYRNFDGKTPEPGSLSEDDEAALAACDSALSDVAAAIEARRFRDGLRAAMGSGPVWQPLH